MEKLHLTTPRLVIRNLKLTDAEAFYDYRSNPEVTRYQGFDVMTQQEVKSFIQEQQDKLFGKAGEWVQYGLENAATQTIIGDCAVKLDTHDPRMAEIGITVSHRYQKRGYAREALRGILQWLFEVKQLHRVIAIADAENIPSLALLKSVGMRQEGHFIQNIWFKGQWSSEYQFAMLRQEWLNQNGTQD
jgi:RimJ/RimL family protein N-acetyltransferase